MNNLEISNLTPDNYIISALYKAIIFKTSAEKNFKEFKTGTIDILDKMEKSLKKMNITSQCISAIKYCVCAFIDETINNIKETSNDPHKVSFLEYLYQDHYGGDKFYKFLDHFLSSSENIYKNIYDLETEAQNSKNNKDLSTMYFLKTAQIIIALGFKGKFFDDPKSITKITERIKKKILKKENNFEADEKPNKTKKNNPKYIKCILIFVISISVLNKIANKYLSPEIKISSNYKNLIYSLAQKSN